MKRLVLASKSEARRALLRDAGLEVAAVGSDLDEGLVKRGLIGRGASAREVAHVLAEEKAKAASLSHDGWVIGADQTLEVDGRMLSKAATLDEARGHLMALRGREHRLHSGVAVAEAGEVVFTTVETAVLHVRAFSDAWVEAYLQRNGSRLLGSVGAYQLEGEGVQLFEAIVGDYFVILGLPLLSLLGFLREQGAIAS